MSLGIPAVEQLNALNHVIYGFHMPLFFLVSGIFADKSLRYSVGTFFKKRVVRYVVPYFAWTLIVVCIKALTPGVQNTQAGLKDLFLSVLVPFEEYWFLYVLFFLSAAYYSAMKGARSRHMKYALLVASALLRVLTPFLPDFWIVQSFCGHAFYFMLGSSFDCEKWSAEILEKRRIPFILGAFVVLNGVYILSGIYDRTGFLINWYGIVLALAGIAAVLAVSVRIAASNTPWKRGLLFCGVNSMQIYCSHPIPMGGVRLILHRLMGTRCLWTRTLLQTCVTMAICCVVFYFWPTDSRLHLILFGEPHIRNYAPSSGKGGSDS